MKELVNPRRSFLKKASIGFLGALPIAEILLSASKMIDNETTIKLTSADVVLFQGDSITDAGRKRTDKSTNNPLALGSGYAFLITSHILFNHPQKNVTFYNRGISGEKVPQLSARWKEDCTDLKPSVLSILVGVNDFWHTKTKGYKGTVSTYENDYRLLLEKTMDSYPDLRLIIGEPWYQPGMADSMYKVAYPEFKAYQSVAKQLAHQFNAPFIPYQSIFDKAQEIAPDIHWSWDGVHPTAAGAHLMANSWLKAINI